LFRHYIRKILLTFNKQGSIRITEVNEFPNATYFEKLATPAVKGKPSEELELPLRHHHYYMLQRLKKPIVTI
jgi:hypothetical protein